MMNSNWPYALNTPGNKSMVIFHSLVDRLPWHDMQPDWQHFVFINGRGEFNAGTVPGGDEYATASFSKDQRIAVLYMPTFRKVGINLGRFAGPLTIQWFDPTSGKYAGGQTVYKNSGVEYVEPPSFKNTEGFTDWVVIVKVKILD